MPIERIKITGRELSKRFERFCIPEPNSGCWLWFGNLGSAGYGNFSIGGKAIRANRASWMIYRGRLKSSKQFICHSCDNKYCVNPDHLFLGNALINVRDCKTKGRNRYVNGTQSPNAKLTDNNVRSIMDDHRPHHVIAAEHGVSVAIISGIQTGKRWKHITLGQKTSRSYVGEVNHKSKLTVAAVRAIRRDRRSNIKIAAEYNVTRNHVWLIKRRRSWRHVD